MLLYKYALQMYAGSINLWRVGLSRQQAHAKCVKGENMEYGEDEEMNNLIEDIANVRNDIENL